MKVIRTLPTSSHASHPVLTIGNFDGQHVGHQALLSRVVTMARQHNGTSMVLTFDPHPASVLCPGVSLQYLTLNAEKFDFFERLGIKELVILEFTRQLASLTPEEFVKTILRDGLGIREVLVGQNFVFGTKRSGDIHDLERLGSEANFQVHSVPPVQIEGEIVSSTRIRKLLQAGHVKMAAQCLGRPYSLAGPVIHGEQRGGKLGWPTANLRMAQQRVVPADGIYATMAYVAGEWWPSIAYIGSRPTFSGGERMLEVHLFDQTRSLYGQHVQVNFIEFIRGDQQFSDVERLLQQMERDGAQARRLLQGWDHRLSQSSSLQSIPFPIC
ncbi:MAG: bifunctional riboflavin kinase/FAD synthetase [Nitrospirales bacterium]|nr:bifunctional riboflavin kinase/FAD synthetase [Nitrospira sp.]MDR4500204.1 bifunctional riboflavin kinase/FAD synthetase [Nitrospirales bacterium]